MRKRKLNKKPLVSVVMPVYNAGDFLVPAIESVLDQTYANIELIIVNDASTDETLMAIKSYQKQFPDKIKLINLTANLNKGGDSCANLAIEQAKGKYIARMDADDVAHPQRIEKQVEFMEKNKDIFLVGTNAHVIDKNGAIIGEKKEPTDSDQIYKSYLTFHPIIHPTAMFRRIVPEALRDPSTSLRSAQDDKQFKYEIKYSANNDYHTFLKLLCQGAKFANLPEKLLYYRIHGKNDTFVNIKEKFINTMKIRLEMVYRFGYRPSLKQIIVGLAQTLIIMLLPEKIITQLYLLAKGIIKKEDAVKDLLNFPRLLILKVQNVQTQDS